MKDINTNSDIIDLTFKINKVYMEYIFPKISKGWKKDRVNSSKQKVNVIIDEVMEQKNIIGVTGTLDNYYLDNDDKSQDKVESNLTVSTIHSAKGLEWDIVFLVDWGDKSFKRDDLKEAQRLNYVAISRAKTELHILSEEFIFGINPDYISNNPNIFEKVGLSQVQAAEVGVFKFGKYKGKKFGEVPKSYLSWLYENSSDFFSRRLLSSRDIDLLEQMLRI
jgi:uncharacterized protein (DUF3820 family)